MRRVLLGLGVFVLVAWGLYAATVRHAGVECEACVEGPAGRLCRTVAGATEEQAAGTAMSNACALVGRNVTERLACERRPPASLACRTR
jgi:hypothetical protein